MNDRLIQKFKNKLANNACVFGPFMKTCDPAFVEVAGWSGMDFVILDMEHGPVSMETMQNNIRAAQVSGVLPIVRASHLSEEAISKALDIGAAGIEIPQVASADDARNAVRYSKFYPAGNRGVCRFVRSSRYASMDKNDFFTSANSNLIILQIEGQEALSNLDEILDVEGIDIIFIGPYDLSQSLGLPGQVSHPKVLEQISCIVKKARAKGIVTGTFCDTPEALKLWMDAKIQYLSYSVDVGIFQQACQELVATFQSFSKMKSGS